MTRAAFGLPPPSSGLINPQVKDKRKQQTSLRGCAQSTFEILVYLCVRCGGWPS
eukprot:m.4105 g.4105  ORF g.4105 m.4105 type:complete len:54 (+) comp4802_c0_seq1:45-206(+)